MSEKETKILKNIKKSIDEIIKEFVKVPFSFYNEREILAVLFSELYKYKILCKPHEFEDKSSGKSIKWDDILLHTEIKTLNKLRKRKKSKTKGEGIFDIVIFDPEEFEKGDIERPTPLIAIELKHDYKNILNKAISKDISKLIDKKNRVKNGFCLIFSSSYEKRLSQGDIGKFIKKWRDKKIENKISIYFINVNYEKPDEYEIVHIENNKGKISKKETNNWKN